MLSEPSTATVRATLPAVGAAIGDIADLFYRKLFAAHPKLLRDLFNRGNQASGTQRQALAGSIAAFATQLVEHPDTRPDVMLGRIANKHASLGITAPQYEIVHTHLFAAIAEVLGDAVTPEVAAAWDEVYWLMANALIAIEERLYAQQGVAAGDVWREWTVVSRVEDTPEVATFRIAPSDGTPAPAFRPGQYVSRPGGTARRRPSDTPVQPHGRARRRPALLLGQAGTGRRRARRARSPGTCTHGCARATGCASRRRTAIWCSTAPTPRCSSPRRASAAPRSCRCWSTSRAGGTPLPRHRGARRPVTGRPRPARGPRGADRRSSPDASAHFWYERPEPGRAGAGTVHSGTVDLSGVPVAPGTRAYLCGPLPFMRAVRTQLLAKGVPSADIHYEVFGPDLWLAQD